MKDFPLKSPFGQGVIPFSHLIYRYKKAADGAVRLLVMFYLLGIAMR